MARPQGEDELTSYQYEPLEPGSIRLLLLFKADNFDDDLECALLHVPLSDDTAYTTLSYVWGTERDTHLVCVSDKHLQIGANLNSALRHLRRRDEAIHLWVDALCIDQRNVPERNDQVQQMHGIYESAKHTVVFVGDETPSNTSISAWNFLERHSTWALDDNKNRDHARPAVLEEEMDFRGDLYDVYNDVLSREWFTRVWVFQEVVVSKDVSIQCGSRGIPWDDFCKIVLLQNRADGQHNLNLEQEDRVMAVRQLSLARAAFHASKHGNTTKLPAWYQELSPSQDATTADILGMLIRSRHLQASDPRDKIFALLGISTGFDWQALHTIDYALSTRQVYVTFAENLMRIRRDYRPLSYLNSAPVAQQVIERAVAWAKEHFKSHIILGLELRDLITLGQLVPAEVLCEENEDLTIDTEPNRIKAAVASFFRDVCHPQVYYIIDEFVKYEGLKRTRLPSWVPNWECIHLTAYEPRAIVEVVPTLQMSVQADSYRSWNTTGNLLVHGRLIGTLDSMISSAFLLRKDETTFEDLRSQWSTSGTCQEHTLEAHLLTMWAHLLDATTRRAEEGVATRINEMESLKKELRRLETFVVHTVLEQPPGARLPRSDNQVSFLDVLDWRTCPPVPGSIEAHLIARALCKTTQWATQGDPSLRVVTDRESIVDERLMGVYIPTEGKDTQSTHYETRSRHKLNGDNRRDSTPRLALLPPTARFDDLIAYFPGADVPFLVRPQDPLLLITPDETGSHGSLSHLDGTETHLVCELIGECWINEWERIAKEDRKLDHVFVMI